MSQTAEQLGQMWDEEERAGEKRRADRPLSFYGLLHLTGRYVVLQKGMPGGKRDWDAATDPQEARRAAIRMIVEPVSAGTILPYDREFLQSSVEGNLFRDTLTGIGKTVRDVVGKYVRVDVVEDARLGTFQDRTTGATRTRNAGVIREVFPDEAACRRASEARYGNGGANGGSAGLVGGNPTPPPPAAGAQSAQSATGGPGLNRETAARFFPGVWQTAGGDADRFLAALAQNKIMAKHFTPDSPEVVAFLREKGVGGDNPIDVEDVPF